MYIQTYGVMTNAIEAAIERPQVAILMPVHNEVDVIESVVEEFYETLGQRLRIEIVLSEDGSIDGTKDVIIALSKRIPLEATLSPERRGYAGGIKDGLKLVKADYVLITDSDGQHTAEDLWKLWELKDQYDIVSGWRVKRADAFYRRVMSGFFQLMTRTVLKLPRLRDVTAPYKLMRTDVAKQIANDCEYMEESFWTEFTIRAYRMGFRIGEVPVTHRRRQDGSTRVYKPWKIPRIVLWQCKALVKLFGELQ